jgi:hypothetical protein
LIAFAKAPELVEKYLKYLATNGHKFDPSVFYENFGSLQMKEAMHPSKNIITKNNFLSAGKIDDSRYENRFISNYYYDWIGVKNKWLFFIPYIIPGRLIRSCPISHFDFSPKSIPYDIPWIAENEQFSPYSMPK